MTSESRSGTAMLLSCHVRSSTILRLPQWSSHMKVHRLTVPIESSPCHRQVSEEAILESEPPAQPVLVLCHFRLPSWWPGHSGTWKSWPIYVLSKFLDKIFFLYKRLSYILLCAPNSPYQLLRTDCYICKNTASKLWYGHFKKLQLNKLYFKMLIPIHTHYILIILLLQGRDCAMNVLFFIIPTEFIFQFK